MPCRLCQLPIEASLCEVCRFLTEEKLPEVPASCELCGFPIHHPTEVDGLCQLCTDLLAVALSSCWLVRAHNQWEQENVLLARRKWELMGAGGASVL